MAKPLTAQTIKHAKQRNTRYAITDAGHPGLRVLVYPSGEKAFAFRYKRADTGKDVTITLGPAAGSGAISLQDARGAASEARRQRARGDDPAALRRSERAAEMARIEAEEKESRRRDDTVEKVLDRYYRDKVDSMRSAPELKRLLSKELASWAKRRVTAIDRSGAIKLIDDIKERGTPVLANRTRTAARTFFGWCIDKALIDDNPFERTKPVATEVARDRILSDAELRLVLIAVSRLDWIWRAFYQLLILTGQRRDEVAGMAWPEINLLDGLWMLPAERSKNKRKHAVPLAPAAIAILRDLPKIQTKATIKSTERTVDSPFLLTTTGVTPISGFSGAKEMLDKAIRKVAVEEAAENGGEPIEVAPWRIHDIRRTVASGMAKLGVSIAVAEKVMNHVSGTFSGIVGVYQHHDFLPEKRHALRLWADHVANLTAPAPRTPSLLK